MSIVESWMPWLFRLETPGLVIFTSLLIALYFWVTETDVGLAITAPWTIKNDRERMAFCSLYRPGFQASELGLLAAFWLLEAVLLGLQGAYYQVIWIGAGLVVLNLLLRLGSAWRNAKAIKGARAIRFVHALVSVVTVIYLVTVGFSILLNMGMGTVTSGMIFWSPIGVVCGIWAVLACTSHGALYAAWKTTNPLRERCRALALVILFMHILLSIILLLAIYMLVILPTQVKPIFIGGGVVSILIYLAMYVTARKRHVGAAYFLGYFGAITAFTMHQLVFYMIMQETASPVAWGQIVNRLPALFLPTVAVAVCGAILALIYKWSRPVIDLPRTIGWKQNEK
ncbi:cytochrome d ubiquinol oxidase subunit II [Negativicoccus succinicivorans]|uniref:cytochrome d ubiquinol oxidase subunit II n=1 Tax=Negativicoccus succinicivorans TaxID=620903 RepID=UPI0029078D8D|nr:cytochrome d ubiquinol oxidase subunit II [Negativicoccus succinicivorans]MDU5288625.1 hypothetical protein [Negativicoccus succinicivorans]